MSSRLFQIGALGGAAGLGGLFGEFLAGDAFFGPTLGGAAGATLVNFTRADSFGTVQTALIGAAAGLAASLFVKRLIPPEDAEKFNRPGERGGLVFKALVGAVAGGAGLAIGADSFLPPELQLTEG